MRRDDPARPLASPGVPALLLDGGYLPHLTLTPISALETKIIVGLRAYESGASYSYTYESITLPTADIPILLTDYYLDPEATLKAHWGWEPRSVRSSNIRFKTVTPPSPDVQALFDLL